MRCTDDYYQYGASTSCPSPAQAITSWLEHQDSVALSALSSSFTKYEVTVNMLKNGQISDTVIFPINSLSVVQNDAQTALNSAFQTDDSRWNREVEPFINGTTVSGGTKFGSNYGANDARTRAQYVALATSTWGETLTHTFDIQDGNVGDHIEIEISNKVTFRFPFPLQLIPTDSGQLILRDWPSSYTSQIENGYDFLGPRFDELEILTRAIYGANDRGVLVNMNDGFIVVTQSR